MPARPGPDAGQLRGDLPAGADLPGGTNPPTGAGPGTGPVRRRPGSAAIGAAVDVGANSVHLLVAVTRGHRLEPLVDESVFLGLGDNVNRTGELGSVSRAELVATLVRYVETARRLGARHVVLVGTEPLRRAADAANAVEDVTRTTGVSLDVLSHEEEGYLTLIGVTSGRRVTAELMVVDVGGGSSELVVVSAVGGVRAAGVRLGSASLTASIVRHDPPTAE